MVKWFFFLVSVFINYCRLKQFITHINNLSQILNIKRKWSLNIFKQIHEIMDVTEP